nr:aminoacyl tRNA synthase complex-interacting multifunctional protein 2-like [Ciona intestinalis]|eukprot:XP_002119620.1 aminoacyl tRNA synthase complex-interacting multifunctional protein 2-like [Ciona intestinalis]
MYSAKPHFEYNSTNVQLPDVMYKASSMVTICDNTGDNNVTQELTSLKQRQSDLLRGLDDMIERVNKMKSMVTTTTNKGNNAEFRDIVIHACPSQPPLSLKYLIKMLRQRFKVLVKVHGHSSVTNHMTSFLTNEETTNRNHYDIIITLIWKSAPDDPITHLHPSSSPIVGESNLARLVGRMLGYYDNTPTSFLIITTTDVIYDACDVINNIGSTKKQRQDALQTLGGVLNNNQWFMGKVPTIVDCNAFSTLQRCFNTSGQRWVGPWLERAKQMFG